MQTQTDKIMTDRYRFGPEQLKPNWTNKKMVDQYRYGPEKLKLNWIELIGRWSIDIGATSKTQTYKMMIDTRWWPINIGAVPKTQTHTDKLHDLSI